MPRLLIAMGIAMAALEAINAPMLGVLFLIELAFLPMYDRNTLLLWIMQGVTLVFSSLGLIAAIGTVVPLVRARRRHPFDTPST